MMSQRNMILTIESKIVIPIFTPSAWKAIPQGVDIEVMKIILNRMNQESYPVMNMSQALFPKSSG
jgi:hypothetical protein